MRNWSKPFWWSRILTGLKKSRDVYNLIQRDKQGVTTRNENEAQWKAEMSIPTMTEARWDNVYRNLSLLKCNLRVKYQEWRIAWKRQELNRDKRHYPGCTSQSTKCSYCNIELETETHIFTQCTRLEPFWREARDWTFLTWGVLALGCFSKDTLKKNKMFTPARYWGAPRKSISRRRD